MILHFVKTWWHTRKRCQACRVRLRDHEGRGHPFQEFDDVLVVGYDDPQGSGDPDHVPWAKGREPRPRKLS